MKKKKTCIVIIVIFILVTIISLGSFFFYQKQVELKEAAEKKKEKEEKELVEEIISYYNKYVTITTDSKLYKKNANKYIEAGTISKDKNITLEDIKITKDTKYFKIEGMDFYIKYKNVKKIDSYQIETRYKKYLPFNENIVTNDTINLYQDDKLVMTINKSLDTPIIIKDDNGYNIEYNNELYFIKKEDVKTTYQKENSTSEKAKSIPVTVYHFIYLNGDNSCNEVICHSENQIREHFTYLNQNNYFTLTTNEILLFIEGKINLPKNSILITIDDGARATNFIPILEEYKINATLFLICSWYDKKTLQSDYLELASHTTNLHTPGKCPGGQGSPLKCGDKTELLNDLRISREYLDGTEAFCFPFYEYNDYAIETVKEAGFKMAFIGGMRKATPGINPYKIPRITMQKNTTLNEYINYIK